MINGELDLYYFVCFYRLLLHKKPAKIRHNFDPCNRMVNFLFLLTILYCQYSVRHAYCTPLYAFGQPTSRPLQQLSHIQRQTGHSILDLQIPGVQHYGVRDVLPELIQAFIQGRH